MTSSARMSRSGSPPREPEPPPEAAPSSAGSASPPPQPHQYRFGLHNDIGNFTAKPPRLYPEVGEPCGVAACAAACPVPCPATCVLPCSSSQRSPLPAPILAVQSTPTPPPSEDQYQGAGGSIPLSVSCHSLTAATTGSSLGSSINDLTLEAEQLERAIRANDVATARRLLELHHGRFSVNLHGSIVDKSSTGSPSQDLEILLRKSQTLLDRYDRGDSVSTDLEPVPPVFASALHLAIEYQSLDVVALLLKYGVEPNEGGLPLTHRRSSSAASEGSTSMPPRLVMLSPSRAGPSHSPVSEHTSPLHESRRIYVPLRKRMSPKHQVVRIASDCSEVTFEEEYTRDFLYSLPPLFLAAAMGKAAAVRLLLKYGAAPCPRDKNGVTPLHLAVCQPQVNWTTVRLLLEFGARIHVANLHGTTPSDLSESDLTAIQTALVEATFAVMPTSVPPVASPGPQPTSSASSATGGPSRAGDENAGPNLRSNILRRLQDSRSGQSHRSSARKRDADEMLVGGATEGSAPIRNRSPGVLGLGHTTDSEKNQERVPSAEPQSSKLNRRKSGDDGRLKNKCHAPFTEETEPAKVDSSLAALTRMAQNAECLDTILAGLKRHMEGIIKLTSLVDGDRLQRPLAVLFNKLLLTVSDSGAFSQTSEPRTEQAELSESTDKDIMASHMCELLRVALSSLRGGQALQFASLLLVNKLVDLSVARRLALRPVTRHPPGSCLAHKRANLCHQPVKENHAFQPLPSVFPWKVPKAPDPPPGRWWWTWRSGTHSSTVDAEPPSQDTGNTFVGILAREGVEFVLNMLNNAITLHKRVVGTRHHCTPSQRWRHCSYHCLQIMSARVILFMSQNAEVQHNLVEEAHLKILINALDSTHDPQLLCMVLQIVATLALVPEHHVALSEAELPDCLTQLILPSDEWYYTNHSTKYARYVKHHAARVLVYLGMEQRLRNKVYLFDLVDEQAVPTTPMLDSLEDSYIVETSLPPYAVYDADHKLLGMTVEAFALELLKTVERTLCSSDVGAEEEGSELDFCLSPVSPYPNTANMSSAAFYLEALHAVVPPVILVRLLQHRFLGTMHIRRGAPSRTSIASENRSRAGSSAGNEDSLRVRRRVTLTINCSSPARAASTSAEERRDSVRPPEKQVTVVPPENVAGPSLSPEHSSPAGRRAFKFSSLKKRVSKVVATTQDQNSSSLQTTSEADIVAFQKELQNLPNFESQVGSGGLYSDGASGTGGGVSDLCHLRPRSCSVPRVTFEAASLQLPHSHGPLIRSATTEGAYTCSPVNKASSAQQPQPPQTLLSACETAAPAHGGGSCELPGAHLTILRLLQEWACKCPGDLRSREFRDFLNRLACMGDPYQWWAEELRVSVDMKHSYGVRRQADFLLGGSARCRDEGTGTSPPAATGQRHAADQSQQDVEDDEAKPSEVESIHDEYRRLRDRVLNGELPVGKDEASILAGVQLRIEESWPSNARSPSALPSDHLGKLIPISEDAKESVIAELPGTTEGSRMSSGDADDSHNDSSDSGGGGDGTGGSGGGTPTSTCRLSGRFARAVPKRRSLILRPFMGSEGNKSPTMAHNTKYKDCLPPAYHSTKNMIKTIKEQRRKLFHSPLYESEIHLKKLYIQTCKRLPVYGCRLFQVKELLRGKTKKRANRVLAIGIEKIVLLDDKTLAVSKWQDTAELLQWRTGGGRAHDRLVLEFRGSKWAFVATHSLRSISTVLWEIMQDLDARFLDEQLITTREELDKESHKNMVSLYGMERVIVYKEELEKLQTLLHFPEEMALRLTNVEYELFYSVDPVHYIRQVTVDLSGKAGAAIPKGHENTVQTLIARFNEVSSWVTHIIISQPTHDDRKAVLSCILRIAMSCWNIGNFNAAMEILAGLKSEKLKPFWLSLSDKDQLPVLDFLSQALLNPEPSKEYREAVQRALNIPHSKVVPFFGTFLRELRAILQGMPSLIVLPSEGARSIEFVADYHGEDHFMTRIGVGGIINVEKMDEAHRVLDEIKAFHHHHKCRKHATAQVAINSQEARRDGCGSSRAEDESLYMQDLAAYIPIQGLKHNHDVSLIPLQVDTVDFHELQILHHGCTIVHWEEDGSRSVLCYARLESHNGTITWCRPTWSALQVSGPRDYSLSANIEECVPIGVVQKCETGESYQAGLEEGFVDLHIVKEIVLCRSSIEVAAVARRHGLEDSICDQNLLRIKFGTGLSENRVLEFILPGTLAEVWYKSIRRLVVMLKQQRQLCDSRIYWLKETFLQLYYNEQNCSGPTAFESIKAFGGRKWSASWVAGSNAVEASAFKRASSFGMSTNKLRKKKSSSSMVPFKDDNAIFVFDIDEGPPRKPSPTVKKRRATVKSSPQMRSQESSPQRLSVSRSSSSCENLNRVDGGVPVIQPIPQTAGDRPCHDSRETMTTSALLNRLVITSGSRLTFSSFVELFRSFMVHARRDIFALFCAMATVYSFSTDEARKAAADRSSKSTTKALGLITRGTKYGCPDPDQDKIFHVVSSSSASTDPDQPEVSKSPVMEPSVFQKFLETQQGEVLTETEVIKLIQRHEPNDLLRKHGRLSFEGFARYLMDKDNFAFVPETISPELDDMDYPMAYYYIASSHNTYLTGHQLKGESSVELYSEVLLRGCRCVELDCWDGDDGIPVIYHGHTLTSKIPFKSVVEAIEKSCFANSPYPIILSIENHCSLQQQAKMAQIFASVFGDKLVTNFLFESDYLDDPHLPSPNQLKYKVLIKNKKLRAPLTPALPFKTKSFQQVKNAPGRTNSIISTASTGSLNDDDDDEYDEDDDDDDVLEESLSSQEGSFKDSRTLSPGTSHPRSRNHADLDLFYSDDDGYKQRKSSSQIAPELSDLVVYCQAIKFRGFVTGASPTNSVKVKKMSSRKNVLGAAGSPLGPSTPPQCSELKSEQILPKRPLASAMCHQVSSINESAAKRLCKRHPLALIAHCDNQLMRTYPAGMRIDSSNFNPVIFWAFGLQMVALNYQTEDAGLHVNAAMFEQNGSCGYVLKPRVMWDRSHMMYGRFNPWDKDFDALHALRLQIKVISGQFLCPNACICSTQVEIEVIGIPVDCNRQKTSIVQRNSFNPSWGTIFNFRVTFPDLAFLRFTVVDVTTSHLLSQRVIPLKSLKQGYRHIRLRSPQNQPLSLATLFVHSTWEEEFVEVPKNGEAVDSGARKNKAKLKDLAESSQREGKDNSLGSTVRTKRRMFFLVVHGVVPDEKKTILKTSQDSTSRDVIAQALHKANKAHESVDNYVLMEEVQKSWDKRQQEKSTTQRILEDDECPLMAQSRWQGDGRFILKKVADDPSTRAWMTTIKSSSNKERRKHDSELGETGLSEWNAGDETYLVCVYNVSSDQPYAILKAPISSTAQDIIAQALVKARRAEDPNNFVLVEEVEYPSTTTESTPLGSSVRRRGPYRDRRVLYDHENVYEVQAQWTAKGLFELRDRNEVTLEQRRGNAPKSSSFYRLSRLRSSMKSKERDKSCPSPKQSPDSSLRHSEPVACQEPGPSQEICEEPVSSGRRQVHSEGETLSDDETQEPPSAVSRLRKISFRKLKVWR